MMKRLQIAGRIIGYLGLVGIGLSSGSILYHGYMASEANRRIERINSEDIGEDDSFVLQSIEERKTWAEGEYSHSKTQHFRSKIGLVSSVLVWAGGASLNRIGKRKD
jgi:hypothetical protein